ncbi:LacI family DNA-binding transcriptional regulator [Salmonella enterica subsp. houtenae]|nr:LacI family DNA-binding transcriptional regulator [Salmonella enterica subsp. houtenae]
MATIKDVASLAGVSTATVSRVINQTAWVEPVTRERVEKAMRDLNYRRNAAAIALAKRSGDMLGLLTGNLADPFFARLARGVEDVSRKQQYRLMVCSGGHDEEMEKAGLDFLVNQGCEAIVVHASRLPDKELLRYAAHFPALVIVNRYIAGMANRCIWLENRSAAREATRYLLANGHRRIACVTSDLPIIDRQERLDGYRQALEEYGISPDPRWVISVPFNEEGGERAAHQLINSGLPLTAAVTFNDVMAAGIMRILHQRGVRLPQQLSIVGFDDVVLARYLYPALTTMQFGLSSLRISNFLIPDPTLRQRFLSRLDAHGLDVFNALSVQAATTAWNESRQWLDSLLDYLAENRRWFVEQAAVHLPWARIVPAQGTYLLWMDCKKLGLDDEQLKWVMADVARIAPSMGSGFGPAGSGFIRLNLGCPRTYLEIAMDGLKRIAVKTIKGAPTGG